MLEIKDLSFSYGTHSVLTDLNLRVKAGQLVALTGLSGSGKSTLLKLIYGSLAPNKGTIIWKQEPLLGPDFNLLPGTSFLRYLAQDFELMPFTSVAENISQHLSVFEPEALLHRTQELLKLIDMEAFAKTRVKNLSGGQQQRVAIAKVLAKAPELLLLDEPFSHIDLPLKLKLRTQLFNYLKKHHIACLLASHHPEDYLGHADEMVCLEQGQVSAQDRPMALYQNPPSLAVAQLFGLVNVIPPSLIKTLHPDLKNPAKNPLLVWPHEWETGSKEGIKAEVSACFFKGDGYMVALTSIGIEEKIYMYSKKAWPAKTEICLGLPLWLCKSRLKSFQ
jgi:iron(III) transport system ATP-binding protein